MPRIDPHAEDAVAVLAPPSTKRPPTKPTPKRVPPSDPPDFFGGWGGDGPGDDGASRGHGGAQPEDLARFGLLLAMIGSSVMFGVFVTVYLLVARGEGAGPVTPLPVSSWLATGLLFGSSLTLVAGTRAGRRRDFPRARRLVGGTVALGCLFLGTQLHLWILLAQGGWIPQRGPGVAMFWTLTALHAGHVVLGIATLLRVLRRGELTPTPPPHPLLAIGTTFWHFLGVLWAILFVVLFATR